ncbi:MAG: NAD(P)-dependent oxidoreductase [Planctomycetaceae bacterium]|nr:NAD(P)-dependent oxidoreductase [Planctomycetaceae bacterium]
MSKTETIQNVDQLDDLLSQPPEYLIDAMSRIQGDLVILGVGGKMGPTLARMARIASEKAGVSRRITGVSRFSDTNLREKLHVWGIETIAADLLDENVYTDLPDADNVMIMTGVKFGTSGNQSLTWAMNTYMPALATSRYRNSRIAAFSTGNVYPFSPICEGGSQETDALVPVGEYATSVLGRERMYEYFSLKYNLPTALLRLNYACELRYGVIVDLAQKIWSDQPVDVSMGAFNVIWQADANAMALAALEHADSPPYILNIAGPETLSVRRTCEALADRMGKQVQITGEEAPSALLNNGQKGHQQFGYPAVSSLQMIEWIADWVKNDGAYHGKPTKFEVRDGKF